jgi:hypothetical protein
LPPALEPVLHRAHCRPDPHHASRPDGKAWDTVKPLAAHGLDPRRVVLVDNDLRKAVRGEERNMVLMPDWGGAEDAAGEEDLPLLAELLERHLLRPGAPGGGGADGAAAAAWAAEAARKRGRAGAVSPAAAAATSAPYRGGSGGGGGGGRPIGDVRLATAAIVEALLDARVARHGRAGQPPNMPLAAALRGLPDPPAHLVRTPPSPIGVSGGGGSGDRQRQGAAVAAAR